MESHDHLKGLKKGERVKNKYVDLTANTVFFNYTTKVIQAFINYLHVSHVYLF